MVEYIKKKTIHFKITILKKKKKVEFKESQSLTKEKKNKKKLAKDRTWKFVGASDNKCL